MSAVIYPLDVYGARRDLRRDLKPVGEVLTREAEGIAVRAMCKGYSRQEAVRIAKEAIGIRPHVSDPPPHAA